jgi:hypothetical protein
VTAYVVAPTDESANALGTDANTYRNFIDTRNETLNVIDSLSIGYQPGRTDPVLSPDNIALSREIVIGDDVGLDDDDTEAFTNPSTVSIVRTDRAGLFGNQAFFRGLVFGDDAGITDTTGTTISSGTAFTDPEGISDAVLRTISRVFGDNAQTIEGEDDFSVALNPQDTTTTDVQLDDQLGVTDAIVVSRVLVVGDNAGVSDFVIGLDYSRAVKTINVTFGL